MLRAGVPSSLRQTSRMESLRRWNIGLTVLHGVQAILILVLAGDFAITITSNFPVGPPGTRLEMPSSFFELAVGPAVALFLLLAAIDHGPSVLINANALRDRTLTCWPSIAIDVKNAGGMYVDKPVVEDGNLITSRKPDDVPVFTDAIIRALSK